MWAPTSIGKSNEDGRKTPNQMKAQCVSQSWRVEKELIKKLPHNLVLIKIWTCIAHGWIRKLDSNIPTTISNHFPSMVKITRSPIVGTIEAGEKLTFLMVVSHHTLQCTSQFIGTTTISNTWHFAQIFFCRGGVVGLNINNTSNNLKERNHQWTNG